MNHFRQRARSFTRTHESIATGVYPFFKRFGPFVDSSSPVHIELDGKPVLMFGSNDYLGLANHPAMKDASISATTRYGTGLSGSRLLNGNRDLTLDLEEKLAGFLGTERALIFSTGFQTNIGSISALCTKEDTIIADHCIHASAWEGMLCSGARRRKFSRNDMATLKELLQHHRNENTMVLVEGVYSIDGDLGNLPHISKLATEFDALLYVDDAHGIGVLGKNGRGCAEHFGVENSIDILAGTFSKAFGSVGGFIAGDNTLIDYVKHQARAFIFSASLPASAIAAAAMALSIIRQEPERRERLLRNARNLRQELLSRGYPVVHGEAPILALELPDEKTVNYLVAHLLEAGIYVNAIWPPAAPSAMIRIHLTSEHTEEHLDLLLSQLERHWPRNISESIPARVNNFSERTALAVAE